MAINGTATTPDISAAQPDSRGESRTTADNGYLKEPQEHPQDVQQEYLSARFDKKKDILDRLTPELRDRIEHEIKRIDKVRKRFLADGKNLITNGVQQTANATRKSAEETQQPTNETKKVLMHRLNTSLLDWQECVRKNKTAMIGELETKRDEEDYDTERYEREREFLQTCKISNPPVTETANQSVVPFAPSRRLPAFIRLGKGRSRMPQSPRSPHVEEAGGPDEQDDHEPLYGLKACAMYFKKTEGEESGWRGWTYKHKGYGKTNFPNQKIPVHELLESTEDNPLMEPCPEDHIRYFHFPTNNMEWIEKAIARYYNEKPQALDNRHHTYNFNGRKTDKLLAREFWRGQMHGSSTYSPTPRTQLGDGPTTAEDRAKKGGQSMRGTCVLSAPSSPELPYMHWETSSRRAKMVQVINETIGYHKPSSSPAFFDVTLEKIKKSRLKTEPKPWRRLLARYLFTLAQVAEQMDYEADERLLRDYVKNDPPLHIRRTLDQYYFVTLDDTTHRDKDQVVYRGTLDKTLNRTQSRVVMVDQLWLWILDDNTIITSFPRRWGRNKPDPSGVHKSLRERFEARPEDIRSIQHLALMIIDQCSRVFFDRTKPLDHRPEVMDIFASAIAHVDQLTAVAYDTFWHHTGLNNLNMLPKAIGNRYLDINPEGALLKEAQDIAEELKMMKRIYNEQIKVVKDFKRYLIHSQGRRAGQLQNLLEDLINSRNNQEDADEENDDSGTPNREYSRSTTEDADETLLEAEGVLDLVRSRKAEIIELEQSALHTCRQLEGFLTLKQQQASIVEAKAALQRAEESVKQGRAIMAFTIVTIFFLPLGFFATFFGMNNVEINEAKWMTLNDQIMYMFSLSTVVIALSTSIAFYPSIRPLLAPIIKPAFALYEILRAETSSTTNKRLEARKWQREVRRRAAAEEQRPRRQRDPASRTTSPNRFGESSGAIELAGVVSQFAINSKHNRSEYLNALKINNNVSLQLNSGLRTIPDLGHLCSNHRPGTASPHYRRPRAHQHQRRPLRPGPLLRPVLARGLGLGPDGHGGGCVHARALDALPLPRLRPHHLDHQHDGHEHGRLRRVRRGHPRAALGDVLRAALPARGALYGFDGGGGVDADDLGVQGYGYAVIGIEGLRN
ncbi:hypothetical protein PG997_011438 [Apiospora hydei]|uniref:Ankyrin repeat protein n=1 Tax=Apiospora hydei TaxID=1337664 RepID=A0ABR1VJ44_9PEZI